MKFHGAGKRAVGADRNDAEFAASCVAELVVAGVLPATGDVMRRAARALTINVDQVVDAYTARGTGKEAWVPIDLDAPEPEPRLSPRPKRPRPPGTGRLRVATNVGDGQQMRRCTRCKGWLAVADFATHTCPDAEE